MSDEPIRLKDAADASDEVRALLRDGAPVPAMSREDRVAILGAIGRGPSGGGPSEGGGGGVAGGAGASKAAVAGLAAVLVAGAAIVAVVVMRTSAPPREAPAGAAASAASAASAPPAASATASPSAPEAASATAPPSAPPAPSAPAASTASPRGSASAHAAKDTLGDESALVARARATLDADPNAALAALDEHARRFPTGELAPERDFLAIKALRRAGRVAEARERARAYAAKHPASPYGPAVKSILGELGGP